MRKLYFSLGVLLSFYKVYAQEKYPSGVPTPLYWIKTEKEKGKTQIKEKIKGQEIHFDKAEGLSINGNPVFYIKERKTISLPLEKSAAEHYSLFVVYKGEKNEGEYPLWSLLNTSAAQYKLVATNRRFADMEKTLYSSYPQGNNRDKVKIHYYQHYKNLESKENNTLNESSQYELHLAGKIAHLPLEEFSGYIGEILLYDRVLSPMEMQQVASYLSIKYGVSLSQTEYKNYYNSRGEKIWDYTEHKEFNQNITAVGKDKEGEISQMASRNSNDEQMITVGLTAKNDKEIPDGYFVFWSDNGKELELKKQKEGQPRGLSRVWLMDYHKHSDVELHWKADPRVLPPLSSDEEAKYSEKNDYYWLVTDSSKERLFHPASTKYHKLGKVSSQKPFIFNNWEDSANGQTAYSIWMAPEMFSHLDIEASKCRESLSGKVRFNIVGGQAPYHVTLHREETPSYQQSMNLSSEELNQKALHLSSGKYLYNISDAYGRTYKDSFYLSDGDAPLPNLNSEYIIAKKPLLLSPEESLPKGSYAYQWYQNGRLVSENKNYLLSQAGDYELRIKNEYGCKSVSKFKTYVEHEIADSQILLYPNPAPGGKFTLQAAFPKTTSGQVSIYTIEGRLVQSQNFYNLSQYEYHGDIGVSGVYIIHIRTLLGESSLKLIVH